MAKRVALVLSDSALEIIEEHAGERERGAWVSTVVEAWVTSRLVVGAGALERVEARLARLEDAVGAFASMRRG